MDTAPTGTIQFETDLDTAGSANTDPMNIRTAGPQAATAARRRRTRETGKLRYAALSFRAEGPGTLPCWTGDVPDFSAELDPQALAAAQAADEADAAAGRTTTAEDFTKAATRLFSEEDEAELAGRPEPSPPGQKGARSGGSVPTRPRRPSIKNRSLAIIERTERRRRRTVTMILIVILLLILAGVGALWWFFRNDLGTRPAAKNYGTTVYDDTAESYLANALEKRPGAVGYLGWPGLDGTLVYAAGTEPGTGENAVPAVLNPLCHRQQPGPGHGGQTPCWNAPATATRRWAQEDVIKENSGFTLYLQSGTYRFKVVAVYYLDPAEEGEGRLRSVRQHRPVQLLRLPVLCGGHPGAQPVADQRGVRRRFPLPDADQHHQ